MARFRSRSHARSPPRTAPGDARRSHATVGLQSAGGRGRHAQPRLGPGQSVRGGAGAAQENIGNSFAAADVDWYAFQLHEPATVTLVRGRRSGRQFQRPHQPVEQRSVLARSRRRPAQASAPGQRRRHAYGCPRGRQLFRGRQRPGQRGLPSVPGRQRLDRRDGQLSPGRRSGAAGLAGPGDPGQRHSRGQCFHRVAARAASSPEPGHRHQQSAMCRSSSWPTACPSIS